MAKLRNQNTVPFQKNDKRSSGEGTIEPRGYGERYPVLGMRSFMYLFLFIYCIVSCVMTQARTVNPLQYGLDRSSSGYEQYKALFRCHQDAAKNGYSISYRGIDTIRIEVLSDFVSIPLSKNVDFCGVVIVVENRAKNFPLFVMSDELSTITVKAGDIGKGLFGSYRELKKGKFLLVIEDENPWCVRKSGTKLIRKDIVVIKDGLAQNIIITSYATQSSKPLAKYRSVDNGKKIIKNLTFVRTSSSTHKTFCLKIDNQYNVELRNILIITPESILYGDAAVQLENCANVTLNDIHIDGTYSRSDKFGYGVGLVNIYGLKVNRMYARCNWGVFGTQSLNNVVLKDCDINRFDIHCYGRDVLAVRCKFSRLYNQISSVYGKVSFDRCEFKDFIPLLIESSYNAYTAFDLEFKKCVFHLDDTHNYILTLFGVPQAYNERPELRRKCLPNITLKDCTVDLSESTLNWMLVKTGGNYYKDSFDYITNVDINNVTILGNKKAVFNLFSEEVRTSENMVVRMR